MYYALVNDGKSTVVDFFKRLFYAYEHGLIKFTNGTRRINFTKAPLVMESYMWQNQLHPAVLIDTAVGKMGTTSISKDFQIDDRGLMYYGGDSLLNVTISCIADSKEERDNLTDICALYLSRPDAKDFFLQRGIDIPDTVAIAGEQAMEVPMTEFKLWQTDLSLDLHLQWEEPVDPGPRLSEILLNITWDDDPPEGKRVL